MRIRIWVVTAGVLLAFAGIGATAGAGSPGQLTETVLGTFTGPNGSSPASNLMADGAGNLYGTTAYGGAYSVGVVFELTRSSSGWTESVLYSFTGSSDGGVPQGGVARDNQGNLYGTTWGGGSDGRGVVYELSPTGGAWSEKVLYSFLPVEAEPYGTPLLGHNGEIYGTTYGGGTHQDGAVFELVPVNETWEEEQIYSFCSLAMCADGSAPMGSLIQDSHGNLYGTTYAGGTGCLAICGTVFELSPSNGLWTENVLHSFTGYDGRTPYAGVVMDDNGNLFGTTTLKGGHGNGTVFELTPENGGWSFNTIHSFSGGWDGGRPYGGVIVDSNGNLYGAAYYGGQNGDGTVFKLAPVQGTWREHVLYNLTGGTEGRFPYGGVILLGGRLYGTTLQGGGGDCDSGCGVAYEIAR